MEQISALHILINLGSYEENRTDLNSHRNRGRLADNRTAAVAVSGYVTRLCFAHCLLGCLALAQKPCSGFFSGFNLCF